MSMQLVSMSELAYAYKHMRVDSTVATATSHANIRMIKVGFDQVGNVQSSHWMPNNIWQIVQVRVEMWFI